MNMACYERILYSYAERQPGFAMKDRIRRLLADAARNAHADGTLPSADFPDIEIEVPKVEAHGDFATNVAMVMAKIQRMAPRRIAEIIIDHLNGASDLIARTEIAGPGFINFHVQPAAWAPLLKAIPTTALSTSARAAKSRWSS